MRGRIPISFAIAVQIGVATAVGCSTPDTALQSAVSLDSSTAAALASRYSAAPPDSIRWAEERIHTLDLGIPHDSLHARAMDMLLDSAETLARHGTGGNPVAGAWFRALLNDITPPLSSRQAVRKEALDARADQLSPPPQPPIRIRSLWTSRPNSAGGVDLHLVWQNTGSKTVKYARFDLIPYNAVDDVVEDEIRGQSEVTAEVTGPVRPGAVSGGDGWYWESVWYNSTIVRAELTRVRLEYMDGTKEEIIGDAVKPRRSLHDAPNEQRREGS